MLDRHDYAEEICLRHRHPLVEAGAGVAKRHADRLGFDDRVEFAAEWFGRFGGDYLDRFEQRQARLDAADDYVDRIRQRLQKSLLAALLQKAQAPPGETQATAEAKTKSPKKLRPANIPIAKKTRPRTADTMKNFCIDQSRPAWVMRLLSVTLFAF